TLLATLGSVTSYTDSTAVNGMTYFYEVSAVNDVGEGALSNERSATPATVPDAPSLVSATPGNGKVDLAWFAPEVHGAAPTPASKVFRCTAPVQSTLLATLGNVTSYTDSTAVNGTTYFYEVSAVNSVGQGAMSNERSATPVTVPAAPSLDSTTP